jgi:hypothetical protein
MDSVWVIVTDYRNFIVSVSRALFIFAFTDNSDSVGEIDETLNQRPS